MNGVSAGSNIDDKSSGSRASRKRRSILVSAALVIVLAAAGFVAINSNQSKKSLSGAVVTTVSTYKNVVTVAGSSQGSGMDQLDSPSGVAMVSLENLDVANTYNNRVQKCVVSGTTWTCLTSAGGNGLGSALNQLSYPFGLAVDASGNVYVADSGNNRVQKWSL